MTRQQLLKKLTDDIAKIKLNHPIRVAIDGIDASGKTILADELIYPLKEKKRNVIRASIDGFHNPRKIRYEYGKDSPEGYFDKSFNHDAIISDLLIPLGPKGNLRYTTAVYDYKTNSELNLKKTNALSNSILLFDGVFLFRPELFHYWDFKIFLDISFNVSLDRALKRDQKLFGSVQNVKDIYLKRYIPGQKIYLCQIDPKSKADIIIDNNNPDIIKIFCKK